MWVKCLPPREATATFAFQKSLVPEEGAAQRNLSIGDHVLITHENDAGWFMSQHGMFPKSFVSVEHEHDHHHKDTEEEWEKLTHEIAPSTFGKNLHDHDGEGTTPGMTRRYIRLRLLSSTVAEATETLVEWVDVLRRLLREKKLDEFELLQRKAYRVMALRRQVFEMESTVERSGVCRALWEIIDKTNARFLIRQNVRFADGNLASLDTTGAADLLYSHQAAQEELSRSEDAAKSNKSQESDSDRRGGVVPSFSIVTPRDLAVPGSPSKSPRTFTVKNIFHRKSGGDGKLASYDGGKSQKDAPRSMTSRILGHRRRASDSSEPKVDSPGPEKPGSGDKFGARHTPLDLRGLRRNLSTIGSQSTTSLVSQQKRLPTDAFHLPQLSSVRHLLINISSLRVATRDAVELHFSLFLEKSKRFVTDAFVVQYEGGKPVDADSTSVLFRDVESADINEHPVVVCRAIRYEPSVKGEVSNLKDPRTPFAVALIPIPSEDWKHRAQKIPTEVRPRSSSKAGHRLPRGALSSTMSVSRIKFYALNEVTALLDVKDVIMSLRTAPQMAQAGAISTSGKFRLSVDIDVLRGNADEIMQSAKNLSELGLKLQSMMKKVGKNEIRLSMAALAKARDKWDADAQTLVTMCRLANAQVARLIHFRSIASLSDTRNDLYVSLLEARFCQVLRAEVSLELLRSDGSNLADSMPGCISHGTAGGPNFSVFKSSVMPRQNNPRWDEMVKICIPPDLAEDLFLVFHLHVVGEGSKAGHRSAPRAYAVLKVADENGAVAASTEHQLTWWKITTDKKKVSLTSSRTLKGSVSTDEFAADFLRSDPTPRKKDAPETLHVRLRLTSTVLSHTAHVRSILSHTSQSREELLKAVQSLDSFDISEHKKLVFPLLDALFDLLEEHKADEVLTDQVFQTATKVVCSISNAALFGVALREYTEHLSDTVLHKHLAHFLTRTLSAGTATKPRTIKNTIQALPLLLKFLIKSYQQYSEELLQARATNRSDSDLREELSSVISGVLDALIGVFSEKVPRNLGVTQVAVSVVPFVFFDAIENSDDKRKLSSCLTSFFDAIPPAKEGSAISADLSGASEKLGFAEIMMRTLTRQMYQHRENPRVSADLSGIAAAFTPLVVDFASAVWECALGTGKLSPGTNNAAQKRTQELKKAVVSCLGAVLDHIRAADFTSEKKTPQVKRSSSLLFGVTDSEAHSALGQICEKFGSLLLAPSHLSESPETRVAALSLLRLIDVDTPEFRKWFEANLTTEKEKRDWVLSYISVFEEMGTKDVFPSHWHHLNVFVLETVASFAKVLSLLVYAEFAESDREVLTKALHLLETLMNSSQYDPRQVDRPRRRVLVKHGDLRQRVFAQIVVPLWDKMSVDVRRGSELQSWFVYLTVRLFVSRVRDPLIHRKGLLIYYENLLDAIRVAASGNKKMLKHAKQATTGVLEALAADGLLTVELFESHLSLQEFEHWLQSNEGRPDDMEAAGQFFSDVSAQTGLLFELATIPEGDLNLGMHERKIDVMMDIIAHMQGQRHAPNFRYYVNKLAQLHHSMGDYAEEAMVLLRCLAMNLDWERRDSKDASLQAQVDAGVPLSLDQLKERAQAVLSTEQVESRVELYDRIIILLNRSGLSELAIPLIQDLQVFFRVTEPDFERVITLLKEEASLMESLITTERYEPVYYLVGLYGGGFAQFNKDLCNSEWILRCSRLERRADVVAKLVLKYPGVHVWEKPVMDDEIRDSEEAAEVFVSSVLAVDTMELVTLREKLSLVGNPNPDFADSISYRISEILQNHCHPGAWVDQEGMREKLGPLPDPGTVEAGVSARERDPYQIRLMRKHVNANVFVSRRPFRRTPEGQEKSENEFEDLWQSNEYFIVDEPLPGTRFWSRVVGKHTDELSPIENAINALKSKNAELDNNIVTFQATLKKVRRGQEDTPEISTRLGPLTMLLDGVIDAAVNGGVAKYQEVFFVPEFVERYPERKPEVAELQRAVVRHVEKTKTALDLHSELCGPAMAQMQQKLEVFFEKMQAELLDSAGTK